jgi:DNA-binding NarL/FixJ family response regulator
MDRGVLSPTPTRVFLVDGRELLRMGVAALLSVQADLEVVGEAGRAADVLPRVRATRPEVVLLGELPHEHPEGTGDAAAELCRVLRAEPAPPVCLLLAAVLDDRTLMAAERAGAAGCVPEDVHGGELVAVLHRLATGAPVHGVHAGFPPPAVPPEPPDPLAGLSATDREIVALISEGLTNRQIGAKLGLSERTIKNHVSRVLAFLGMERRTQIAALASTLRQPVGG